MSEQTVRKAFACQWKGTTCYVAATTPGKARAVTNFALQETLSEYDQWNSISVRRAPQYDQWAATAQPNETRAPEYMPEVQP